MRQWLSGIASLPCGVRGFGEEVGESKRNNRSFVKGLLLTTALPFALLSASAAGVTLAAALASARPALAEVLLLAAGGGGGAGINAGGGGAGQTSEGGQAGGSSAVGLGGAGGAGGADGFPSGVASNSFSGGGGGAGWLSISGGSYGAASYGGGFGGGGGASEEGGGGGGGGYSGGGGGAPGNFPYCEIRLCKGGSGGGGGSYIDPGFTQVIEESGGNSLDLPCRISVSGCGLVTINSTDFNFTGAAVYYTVPTDGTYDIVAYGASGASITAFPPSAGGLGAVIGGDIFLSAGTELAIVVGGVGFNEGGGGGSFVLETGVPEPSTWAMMLLGFAGLGFVGYRRNRGSTRRPVSFAVRRAHGAGLFP